MIDKGLYCDKIYCKKEVAMENKTNLLEKMNKLYIPWQLEELYKQGKELVYSGLSKNK